MGVDNIPTLQVGGRGSRIRLAGTQEKRHEICQKTDREKETDRKKERKTEAEWVGVTGKESGS